MYVTYYSSYNNIKIISPITINSDGTFSFNYTVNYLGDFNIYISDNSSGIYGDGYYESNIYVISTIIIGPPNLIVSPTSYNLEELVNYTILLSNWNSSYEITELYIFKFQFGSDPILLVISPVTIINTNNVYTLEFSNTFVDNGPYYYGVSDTSDLQISTIFDIAFDYPIYGNLSFTQILTPISQVISNPNTYYFQVLDQNNTDLSIVNVSNLILDTVSSVDISENIPFNINLNNWSTIVNTIGVYSNQITNFDLSIGISTTDPSPVFVINIPITYVDNNYILEIPGLVNVNNKYLYFTKTVNDILISIPPILISYFNLSMVVDRNYGILNTNETYNLTITASINPFNSKYPSVYLYYATIPNAILEDLTLFEYIVVSNNSITFTTNQTESVIYFYISTDINFSGYTASVGPIHFINPTILLSNLDIYDANINTGNILLTGWSPYFREITNLNVLSESDIDYSRQTLYKTLLTKTFKPTNISNLNLWLDASTIYNFIFDNSNYISQWTDNSINNNNATTSSYPIYNSINKGVNFSGGNYLNLPNGTIPYNDESYHIFIVLTPSNTTNNVQFILGSMDNTDTPTTNETNTFFISNNLYIQSWNNGIDLQSLNYIPSEKQIVSFEYLSQSGRSTYINTVLSGTDNQVSNESSMYNNMIGGILNNMTFNNLIHEIIIYNTKLTTLEKQKVENYLNNKWLI
jgi:hypothetical protein